MEFLLVLTICSSVVGDCLPEYTWRDSFRTHYDCAQFGYKEAQKKLEEIGREDVNEHGIMIKFSCTMVPGISS
tara:strand:- start:317 stop:535 length:219 start_codon:yes stop_codon:yes gene_type:complete